MRTRELLEGLNARRTELVAELKGIEAAIAAMGGTATSTMTFTPKRFKCIICGRSFTAKKKAFLCERTECRTARKNQVIEAKTSGKTLDVPVRQQAPRNSKATILVAGAKR